MGRAEREILEQLRESDFPDQAWDSSRVAKILYQSDSSCPSKIRQTYRVLERTRVVPDALSAEDLIARCESAECAEEIQSTIQFAHRQRRQISIVQVKEIRLGQWAVAWNNLRLARHWLWLNQAPDANSNYVAVMAQIVATHRPPFCLLFDRSSHQLRDFFASKMAQRLHPIGHCRIGYLFSESE